jgi:hypothetical protein
MTQRRNPTDRPRIARGSGAGSAPGRWCTPPADRRRVSGTGVAHTPDRARETQEAA